ncbi:MAG: disulfide bond formation protein B, partial [Mangrovicoccus sp.]
RNLVLLAGAGSAGLLIGAWIFQFGLGLNPCPMCLWQRYPHGVAVVISLIALLLGQRIFPLLGAAVMAVSTGLGLYHTGVERGWWEGPNTCTGADIGSLSADALFDQLMTAPIIRCDEVTWSMLGLSMSSWNAVISAGLMGVWIILFLRKA